MNSDRKTILIVEDDANDALLIRRAFLETCVRCPIHVLSTGAEAICYLMGEGIFADRRRFAFPSLILTDLKMAGGDGFEVLEHLKANPDWGVIPVIVLSTSDDADDIKKAYMLGASSYHLKPSSYEELCAQIKLLHDYWSTCRVPAVDANGRRLITDSRGKLGERYPQTIGGKQMRCRNSE